MEHTEPRGFIGGGGFTVTLLPLNGVNLIDKRKISEVKVALMCNYETGALYLYDETLDLNTCSSVNCGAITVLFYKKDSVEDIKRTISKIDREIACYLGRPFVLTEAIPHPSMPRSADERLISNFAKVKEVYLSL